MENMESMDEETFAAYFGTERTWSTLTSDGTVVPLRPDGTEESVTYGDRLEYSRLVQQTRMTESSEQVQRERERAFIYLLQLQEIHSETFL